MKKTVISAGLLSLALIGCGEKKEDASSPTGVMPLSSSSSAAPAAGPETSTPVAVKAPTGAPPPPPPPGAPPAPASSAGPVEVTKPGGDPGQEALKLLNRAYSQYSDPSSRPGAGDLTPEATKSYPALSSLDDLVKAGFLKSIPPAPAGKQFALDRSRGEIILIDKK